MFIAANGQEFRSSTRFIAVRQKMSERNGTEFRCRLTSAQHHLRTHSAIYLHSYILQPALLQMAFHERSGGRFLKTCVSCARAKAKCDIETGAGACNRYIILLAEPVRKLCNLAAHTWDTGAGD